MAIPVAIFLMLLTLPGPETLSAQAAATRSTGHGTGTMEKRAVRKGGHDLHSAHRRAVSHRRRDLHGAKPAIAVAAVPAAPPAPVKPNWPVDQPPQAAHVTWDSHGLEINASNSSLDQILHEVATDTGAHLDGPILDERIFGSYGPGPARDVLSELLDGSGYNVLLVGGRGDQPPQQIILTKSTPGSPPPPNAAQAHKEEESEAEDLPQPEPNPDNPQPMPLRNPFGAGPGRTPQEMQQEMLMRQQQLEQQRQEQQEQQQNNNPQ